MYERMKIFAALCLTVSLLLPAASCTVLVKKDNGKHKGWFENKNNPYNPASSKTMSKEQQNQNGCKDEWKWS